MLNCPVSMTNAGIWLPVLICCLAALGNGQTFHDNITVELENGQKVMGRLWKYENKNYLIFYGIPYAEAPVGPLRFMKPKKKEMWSKTPYLALRYGNPCVQFMDYHHEDKFAKGSMVNQSEDCLFLNIFGPHNTVPGTDLAPVVVWIHGGSYLAGSGDTGIDPLVVLKKFAARGVMVVTINYRLGPIGFITSSDPNARGNFGLWDQVEALRWVKENIRFFGGNSSAVTVMGESAGGSSVSILALSPVTEGLLHRAIIMSGSITASWAVHRFGESKWDVRNVLDFLTCRRQFAAQEISEIFGKERAQATSVGCPLVDKPIDCPAGASLDDTWKCFREKADFNNTIFRKALTMELSLSEAFMDDELIPSNLSGLLLNGPRVPIMTGTAELEWGHKKEKYYSLMYYQNVSTSQCLTAMHNMIEMSYAMPKTQSPSTLQLIVNATHYHYMGKAGSVGVWNSTALAHLLRVIESDIEFVAPCAQEAAYYATKGLPVYLYSFGYLPSGKISETEIEEKDFFDLFLELNLSISQSKISHLAAFHGLDHAFLFTEGYSSNHEFKYTQADYNMAELLTTLVTNFVKFGNPTPQPVQGIEWEKYSPEVPRYLWIKNTTELIKEPYHWQGVSFWNSYVPYLQEFVARDAVPQHKPLVEDERVRLAAYERAWWALWILVAAIAVGLWTVVVCVVARRCMNKSSQNDYPKKVVVRNM